MGLLNKIYGLVQARRCLFYIFCDNFEQSEVDRRVFRKFDDGDGGVCARGRHPCSRPSDDGEVRR